MSAEKTGIVIIDVGWHRRTGEKWGFPPSDEPEVVAGWEVENPANPQHPRVDAEFENVDEAIAWARERAPLVIVRLGDTEDTIYSAGEQRAINDLSEDEEPEQRVPFPEWPPPGRE